MPRLAMLAIVIFASGCSLYFDNPSSTGSPDAALPADCPSYTATIFEPADGATVPRALETRVRWNQPDIPDRYEDFHDDYGNYFQSTGDTVQGDGSIVEHYQLPANGSFTLEIGWFCDAGGPNERTIPLARVHMVTGAM